MNQRYDSVKRLLDIAGAGTAILCLSPVLLVAALGVAVNLGRPVIFRQERIGLDGRTFTLLKLRSMTAPNSATVSEGDAARLTPFGRALRASSIDELPSLLNVLRGDMSLVGPRPLLPEYLQYYNSHQARRHEVRPGITGLAQVRGRNELSWRRRFDADVEYVDQRGLVLDGKILIQTVGTVIRRHGVSAPGHATQPRFLGNHDGDQPS